MNFYKSVVLSVFLVLTVPNVIALSNPPIVDLGYAQYQGVRNNDTSNIDFLGVRYAKSPTGSLRWKAPQSPDSVPGIQLANSQPPMCFQAPGGMASESPFRNSSSNHQKRDVDEGLLPEDEDCLFLNVYVPGSQYKDVTGKNNDTDPGGLPVLVWIHGGGYHSGSAANSSLPGNTKGGYDGEDLLRISNDRTIVVVIQYRLGLFGFLAGETVKNDGALNAGLLDQQFALQWVQQHISKFGGDPNRVVIWGQSSGANSVLNHIIANNGQTDPPLFIGAIAGSLYLPSYHPYNDNIPEAIYNEVVDQTNCTNSQDTLSCLRNTDVALLSAANFQIAAAAFFETFVLGPVVDGSFIAQRPSELLAEGHLNKVQKVLTISNTFEGTIFINPNVTSLTEFVKGLFPTLSEETVTDVVETYSGSNSTADTSVFDIAAQIYGESTFTCPTYYLLDAFQGLSYKGLFAIPPALHADDVFYYFTSLNRSSPPVYNNTDFDKAFPQSFLAFATSEELDPNDKFDENILPEWPLWNGSAVNDMPQEMLFNRTEDFKPVVQVFETDEDLLRRCGFWRSITVKTSQ
ncbi:alpha/beta-hydrolase [Dendrothele bispora CBS 962.96]|uniref:Carboxylic ester hydrolase n=1 Tax=Dendrothele bispora (strain CBS 962.96) TaxID=1314807 RepID=A0A4S8KXK0_DENBC|nr:alpha/beta-hydrolase [Dendrothele bispora CBS 962.96]